MRSGWLGIIAAMAALPATALAQAPVAPAPVSPAPAPAARHARLHLELRSADPAGVLAGEHWVVRGTLKPYVGGQHVAVRFYRRGRKILVRDAIPQHAGNGGRFELGFTANGPGTIVVRASHRATPALATVVAPRLKVGVLALHAQAGDGGAAVRMLQRRLVRIGYVVGQRGQFDARTGRAVMAFRKVTGMARTEVASADVFAALARGKGIFRPKFPQDGRHVEADISRQVLALIDHGVAVRVYPTSTGSPVTPTVQGRFHVYSKSPGYNAKLMYYSSFFIRGYAIHGYSQVPPYNASHGCLRVPIPDAVSIYSWVRFGTPVDVYQ